MQSKINDRMRLADGVSIISKKFSDILIYGSRKLVNPLKSHMNIKKVIIIGNNVKIPARKVFLK
jgi:hypothetical protein